MTDIPDPDPPLLDGRTRHAMLRNQDVKIDGVFVIKGRGLVLQVVEVDTIKAGDTVVLRALVTTIERSFESSAVGLILRPESAVIEPKA